MDALKSVPTAPSISELELFDDVEVEGFGGDGDGEDVVVFAELEGCLARDYAVGVVDGVVEVEVRGVGREGYGAGGGEGAVGFESVEA